MTIRAPLIYKPAPIVGASSQVLGSAMVLLTAVVLVPFANPNMSVGATRNRSLAPDQVHTNINLLTNPVPFSQTSWPSVSPIKSSPPAQGYNLNLYTAIVAPPFIPVQWGGGKFINAVPAFVQPYNPGLYTNFVPFNQYDWSKPFQIAPKAADVYQPYSNFYTPVVVLAPFFQTAWPPVNPIRPVAPQAQPYNSQLYTNPIPFAQYDWSKPVSIAPRASDVYQPYGNFYTPVVVTAPFYQTSWPAVTPIRPVAPQPVPYNANLYTNPIPFSQYDWSKPFTIRPRASDVFQPYGNFYTPVFVPTPFYQTSWPVVTNVKPNTLAPAVQGTNPNLFPPVTPPPFIGNSYRLLTDHYLSTGYYAAGSIVTEGVEIPVGWPPSVAVEPLNTGAIQAFWNVGPQILTGEFSIYSTGPTIYRRIEGVQAPAVRWQQSGSNPGTYILTGAGAVLGTKSI